MLVNVFDSIPNSRYMIHSSFEELPGIFLQYSPTFCLGRGHCEHIKTTLLSFD